MKLAGVMLAAILLSGCAWCGDPEGTYWRCLPWQTPEIGVLQQ